MELAVSELDAEIFIPMTEEYQAKTAISYCLTLEATVVRAINTSNNEACLTSNTNKKYIGDCVLAALSGKYEMSNFPSNPVDFLYIKADIRGFQLLFSELIKEQINTLLSNYFGYSDTGQHINVDNIDSPTSEDGESVRIDGTSSGSKRYAVEDNAGSKIEVLADINFDYILLCSPITIVNDDKQLHVLSDKVLLEIRIRSTCSDYEVSARKALVCSAQFDNKKSVFDKLSMSSAAEKIVIGDICYKYQVFKDDSSGGRVEYFNKSLLFINSIAATASLEFAKSFFRALSVYSLNLFEDNGAVEDEVQKETYGLELFEARVSVINLTILYAAAALVIDAPDGLIIYMDNAADKQSNSNITMRITDLRAKILVAAAEDQHNQNASPHRIDKVSASTKFSWLLVLYIKSSLSIENQKLISKCIRQYARNQRKFLVFCDRKNRYSPFVYNLSQFRNRYRDYTPGADTAAHKIIEKGNSTIFNGPSSAKGNNDGNSSGFVGITSLGITYRDLLNMNLPLTRLARKFKIEDIINPRYSFFLPRYMPYSDNLHEKYGCMLYFHQVSTNSCDFFDTNESYLEPEPTQEQMHIAESIDESAGIANFQRGSVTTVEFLDCTNVLVSSNIYNVINVLIEDQNELSMHSILDIIENVAVDITSDKRYKSPFSCKDETSGRDIFKVVVRALNINLVGEAEEIEWKNGATSPVIMNTFVKNLNFIHVWKHETPGATGADPIKVVVGWGSLCVRLSSLREIGYNDMVISDEDVIAKAHLKTRLSQIPVWANIHITSALFDISLDRDSSECLPFSVSYTPKIFLSSVDSVVINLAAEAILSCFEYAIDKFVLYKNISSTKYRIVNTLRKKYFRCTIQALTANKSQLEDIQRDDHDNYLSYLVGGSILEDLRSESVLLTRLYNRIKHLSTIESFTLQNINSRCKLWDESNKLSVMSFLLYITGKVVNEETLNKVAGYEIVKYIFSEGGESHRCRVTAYKAFKNIEFLTQKIITVMVANIGYVRVSINTPCKEVFFMVFRGIKSIGALNLKNNPDFLKLAYLGEKSASYSVLCGDSIVEIDRVGLSADSKMLDFLVNFNMPKINSYLMNINHTQGEPPQCKDESDRFNFILYVLSFFSMIRIRRASVFLIVDNFVLGFSFDRLKLLVEYCYSINRIRRITDNVCVPRFKDMLHNVSAPLSFVIIVENCRFDISELFTGVIIQRFTLLDLSVSQIKIVYTLLEESHTNNCTSERNLSISKFNINIEKIEVISVLDKTSFVDSINRWAENIKRGSETSSKVAAVRNIFGDKQDLDNAHDIYTEARKSRNLLRRINRRKIELCLRMKVLTVYLRSASDYEMTYNIPSLMFVFRNESTSSPAREKEIYYLIGAEKQFIRKKIQDGAYIIDIPGMCMVVVTNSQLAKISAMSGSNFYENTLAIRVNLYSTAIRLDEDCIMHLSKQLVKMLDYSIDVINAAKTLSQNIFEADKILKKMNPSSNSQTHSAFHLRVDEVSIAYAISLDNILELRLTNLDAHLCRVSDEHNNPIFRWVTGFDLSLKVSSNYIPRAEDDNAKHLFGSISIKLLLYNEYSDSRTRDAWSKISSDIFAGILLPHYSDESVSTSGRGCGRGSTGAKYRIVVRDIRILLLSNIVENVLGSSEAVKLCKGELLDNGTKNDIMSRIRSLHSLWNSIISPTVSNRLSPGPKAKFTTVIRNLYICLFTEKIGYRHESSDSHVDSSRPLLALKISDGFVSFDSDLNDIELRFKIGTFSLIPEYPYYNDRRSYAHSKNTESVLQLSKMYSRLTFRNIADTPPSSIGGMVYVEEGYLQISSLVISPLIQIRDLVNKSVETLRKQFMCIEEVADYPRSAFSVCLKVIVKLITIEILSSSINDDHYDILGDRGEGLNINRKQTISEYKYGEKKMTVDLPRRFTLPEIRTNLYSIFYPDNYSMSSVCILTTLDPSKNVVYPDILNFIGDFLELHNTVEGRTTHSSLDAVSVSNEWHSSTDIPDIYFSLRVDGLDIEFDATSVLKLSAQIQVIKLSVFAHISKQQMLFSISIGRISASLRHMFSFEDAIVLSIKRILLSAALCLEDNNNSRNTHLVEIDVQSIKSYTKLKYHDSITLFYDFWTKPRRTGQGSSESVNEFLVSIRKHVGVIALFRDISTGFDFGVTVSDVDIIYKNALATVVDDTSNTSNSQIVNVSIENTKVKGDYSSYGDINLNRISMFAVKNRDFTSEDLRNYAKPELEYGLRILEMGISMNHLYECILTAKASNVRVGVNYFFTGKPGIHRMESSISVDTLAVIVCRKTFATIGLLIRKTKSVFNKKRSPKIRPDASFGANATGIGGNADTSIVGVLNVQVGHLSLILMRLNFRDIHFASIISSSLKSEYHRYEDSKHKNTFQFELFKLKKGTSKEYDDREGTSSTVEEKLQFLKDARTKEIVSVPDTLLEFRYTVENSSGETIVYYIFKSRFESDVSTSFNIMLYRYLETLFRSYRSYNVGFSDTSQSQIIHIEESGYTYDETQVYGSHNSSTDDNPDNARRSARTIGRGLKDNVRLIASEDIIFEPKLRLTGDATPMNWVNLVGIKKDNIPEIIYTYISSVTSEAFDKLSNFFS